MNRFGGGIRCVFCPAVALLAGLALTSTSCRAPTEITVSITTDFSCSDLKGTAFISGTQSELSSKPPAIVTANCDDSQHNVGTVVLIPTGGADGEVAFRVVAGFGTPVSNCLNSFGPGCIEARRSLRYVPHTSLLVPVLMSTNCNGVVCGSTSTCAQGKCVSATIDSPTCAAPGGCTEASLRDAGASEADAAASDAGSIADAAPTCDPAGSDPHNCGWCGHDCLGTACNAGLCAPIPLYPHPQMGPIALDLTYVYFSDIRALEVGRVHKSGASNDNYAAPVGSWDVSVDPTYFWWTGFDGQAPAIMRCLLGSPGKGEIWRRVQCDQIAVDKTSVFWSDGQSGGGLFAAPKSSADAGIVTISATEGKVDAMVLDDKNIYWVNAGTNSVMYAPKDGSGTPTPLSPPEAYPLGIAIDGSQVYWTANLGGTVRGCPTTGCPASGPMTIATGQPSPQGIAVGTNHQVYWTNVGSTSQATGSIMVCDRPDIGCASSAKTIAKGLGSPRSIAVDDQWVYWSNSNNDATGGIYKVAR